MDYVRLSDIATFQQGKQISVDFQYERIDFGLDRFIRIIDYTNKNEPPRFVKSLESKYYVSEDDLVMIRYGSQTAGTVVRGIAGIIANNLFQIKVIDKSYDKGFLYYYLSSEAVKNQLMSAQSSSTMPAITFGMMNNIQVPIIELKCQKKITSLLDVLSNKIDQNEKINDNLEKQAEAVYHNLFIVSADPAWREGTISDLGTVVGGSTPSKARPEYYTEHGIAWITPKDLSVDKSKFISHGADDITELGLQNSSASIMPRGTVLFSSRAPIGYIAIADGDVTTNQGFKSIVPYDNVGTAFVYYFLKDALPTIESMASGSTFKEISGSAMRNVPAIVPDDATLQSFSDFCAPLFQQQRTLEKQNRELATIRDMLLPRLMSGEIDVSQIAI